MTASAAPNNPGSETFTILVKLSELWWDCWPAQYGSMDVTLAPFYVDEISEAEPEKGKNRTKFLGLNVPNKILTHEDRNQSGGGRGSQVLQSRNCSVFSAPAPPISIISAPPTAPSSCHILPLY